MCRPNYYSTSLCQSGRAARLFFYSYVDGSNSWVQILFSEIFGGLGHYADRGEIILWRFGWWCWYFVLYLFNFYFRDHYLRWQQVFMCQDWKIYRHHGFGQRWRYGCG